ncbi:MAG: PAS domain-containing sensor histidine kinase [Bacteroidetes bacterium]|nr:PAS domain-containing sensor histidine kinase [Bacteroidota bacterium]
MNRNKKESEKVIIKKTKIETNPRPKKPGVEKLADVKKLVHLLQVHQIELEHQNEELRITQEELEMSRNKYVNLFDFSPIPYLTLNAEGTIKEVNISASKMFGVYRNKLIGNYFIKYLPLYERNTFNSFLKTLFSSPVKQHCELKVINKDKHEFNVLVEGIELVDNLEQEQKCQIALIDLTEYKQVEDDLKKNTEKLTILNAQKDKFFSIISPDLRSPFRSLLSSSEFLATGIESLSHDEIVLFGKSINDNLHSLYGLLKNLLNWSMMQRNMLAPKPTKIKLNDIVNNIIKISDQAAVNKNISISNNVNPQSFVFADADMIDSVIHNLIINAIKFTPTGGKITVSSLNKNGFMEVSVKDNGIGIKKENISELFEFNTLFSTVGTAGENGTGLGLPLCKEFIEKNNGKIWVKSEQGKGSTFTFTLKK